MINTLQLQLVPAPSTMGLSRAHQTNCNERRCHIIPFLPLSLLMGQWVLSSSYYSYSSNDTSRCKVLETAFESLAIFLLCLLDPPRSSVVVLIPCCSLALPFHKLLHARYANWSWKQRRPSENGCSRLPGCSSSTGWTTIIESWCLHSYRTAGI